MDGSSLNQYEEQLYSMFKSFDVNNEEALDESAVHALCDALQLEERGVALADALFEQRAGRVTFQRFRSGLLAVLGDEAPAGAGAAELPPEPPPPPPPPDLEPGLAFGSKRYGRRSRPASPRAASASRLDAARGAGAGRPRERRSASAAPDPAALEHGARIDGEGALALCRDLRMDGIDRRIVERIFEDSPTADTTVGEFFERLDSTLARAVSETEDEGEARLSPERLLREWERAGVSRPRRLLAELGFGDARVLSATELERALDAALRGAGADDARALGAALLLARERAAAARRRAACAAAERDKLRADVAEANARAALLAREVDENHARIEREAKENLRRATTRHAEETRRARVDAEAEAERWSARLEAEVARRGEAEARLRAEAEELARRGAGLEERLGAAEAALEAARGERARLLERLGAAEAQAREAAAGAARGAEAQAQRAALARELRRAQDRADELAAALEAARAPPPPPAASPPAPACDANLSAELGALLQSERSDGKEEADVKSLLVENKVTVTSASVQSVMTNLQLMEVVKAESSDAEMPKSVEMVETQTTMEADALDDEERERLRELVKELEAALEAMRLEYEACEEYWARKQRDERAHHDTELRAADARLAALLARVAAFERRLLPPAPPALAPIPEAAALEAQVAALQHDHEAAARDAAARLQRAHDQLARTQRRLAALQRRRGAGAGGGGGGGGAAEGQAAAAAAAAAGARAARAEAAARRLAARLVAADLLVKELYVENCQLARHPP